MPKNPSPRAVRPAAAQSDAALVELQGIAMTFRGRDHGPDVQVFDGVDVGVGHGELVVVAGRSGSGKTTLLNIAAGLLRPTRGVVRWSGVAVGELSSDALAQLRGRSIGIVFQNAALIETLTAAENVALAAVPNGLKGGRTRAMELLEQLGVAGRARHYPAHLSGGEQQRVAVARALFADPPLLIVDEPTANLDRRTADEVIGALRRLAGEGRGLLVASHDVHAIDVADRVIELEATRFRSAGP